MKIETICSIQSLKKRFFRQLGLFIFILLTTNHLFSQVSVNVRNQSVRQILKTIEQTSDYSFFYNHDLPELNKVIDFRVDNVTIDGALDQLFGKSNVAYKKERDNLIILTIKDIPVATQADNKRKISGTVNDPSGFPVIGANVVVKDSNIGTVTDIDGHFTMDIHENAVLRISYIGYLETEVPVGNRTVLQISLQEDTQNLEDVVVIGYGSVRKRDLTGSVSQVTSETLANQAVMKDPIQALQGKIAGADITVGNSPGSSSTIIIRGYNSLNAGNNPLIVVDNAPFGGRIDEINPAEIETIDILKDASSTAIYGSRGANGVIIITTKRAKKDSRLRINYHGYYGISKSFKNFDMMSGEKYAEFKRAADPGRTDREIFDDIQLNAIHTGRYTDWQDEMFSGGGYKTDHNVTINQSAGKNRNMIVLGYNKDQSIIDNIGYERFSARLNGDMELAPNLSLGYSSLMAITTRQHGAEGNVWKYGTVIDPLTKIYDDNGEMLFYNSGWYQTVLHSNPIYDTYIDNVENKETRIRNVLNLFADWQIIDGLTFKTNFTFDHSSIDHGKYYDSLSQARKGEGPSASYQKYTEKQIVFTNLLNYKKTFGLHSLDVSAVNDIQTYTYEIIGLTGQDMPYYGSWYNVNEAADVFSRTANAKEWKLLSWMGRINYSFNDRYLLTLTGRYDGSSRLAKGNKWSFFPSAALAWRMKEESFLKEVDILSNLKIRASWGNTGNTAISEYATLGALGRYIYYFGQSESSAIGYLPTELPNTELGWERTEEFNLGIDFGFLNNRISGTIDIYQRNTKDLLMQRKLPFTSGYDQTWQNIGKTRNSGIEVTANFVPVVIKDFRWTLDLSFAYNKNQIIELFNGKEDSPGNKWFIGQPFYVERLYEFDGIWQLNEAGEAAKYGREPGDVKIKDVNENYVYDDEDRRLYNRIPKWTAGLSTGFYYKNWDLNLYFYTRQNYGAILGILTDEAGSTRYNHQDVDFWTPENPSNTFPKPRITNPNDILVNSDYVFRDLSFVRLKNMNLGYTIPRRVSGRFYAERLRVYFMVDNPFVWTKSDYPGLDPENGNAYTDHRPLTSFIFGVNVSF
ncbi:MAG: TonB-dependent receptor [Tannerellaceae bacterium]|nr:TonB-dependent receptor [Tannerellaceae bacterium]